MKLYAMNLNSEEKKYMKASYGRIVTDHISNLVLCNNIMSLDESVYDNAINLFDEDGEMKEIYQTYICDIPNYYKDRLAKMDIIISYSDMLDCDLLLVDHFGTSWSYVLTDVDVTTDFNEAWRSEDEQ